MMVTLNISLARHALIDPSGSTLHTPKCAIHSCM